jgi:hypothetical protein
MTPKRPPVSSFTSRDQRRGAEVIRKQLDATDAEQDPTLREDLARVADLLDGKRRALTSESGQSIRGAQRESVPTTPELET